MNVLKRSITVGVRVQRELYEKLKAISEARGEDVSDFVRRAIKMELARLSFLSEDEKKALGFHQEHKRTQIDSEDKQQNNSVNCYTKPKRRDRKRRKK